MAIGTSKPLGNMIIGIDLDNSKFTSSMTAVQRSIRTSSAEMKAQMGVFTSSGKNIDALKAKHDGLIKILALEQKNMQFLKQKYDEASNGGKNYNATVAKLQNQINKSVSEQARLQTQIEQTNKSYLRAASSATIFRDKLTNVGSKMKETGTNMTQAFGPAAAAMGLGLGYAVKSAADFEQTMSGVKSVMDPADVQKYSGALEHLAIVQGAKTKYSATEAAQAEEELVKAGVSVADIMHGALSGALSLATAGELDLKDAAEIASTALNAFRKDHLSVAKAADILAGAANASATDVSELKFSLSAASAVAAGVGLSFHDTATALAVFAQNGLKGSDAGTSLKTMLSRLTPMTTAQAAEFESLGLYTVNTSAAMDILRQHGIKPMSKDSGDLTLQLQQLAAKLSGSKEGSVKATKEFNSLAQSSGAVHSAFYKNNGQLKSMADIAQILKTHLHNLNGEQRQQALYTIFGSDAIRGANILFREGAKGVDAMAASMDKIKAADVAKQKMDNFKGTLEQLRGSLETAGITIGEADLPMLKALANDVQGVVDWFNKLSPSMQHFIAGSLTAGTAGLGVATGLGAMMSAIGGGMDATGKLVGRLNTLKTLLIGTRAAAEGEAAVGLASVASKAGLLTSVLPLLTNPIGLTVGALAALGIGAAVVYHHMNSLQDTSTKTADAMIKSHDALQKEVNVFDDLRTRSLLTRSELGKYIDLQDQLNKTTDPSKIKSLKDQMEQLRQKSGLSNKQLQTMADLSVSLAKKVPGSTNAVTKEGKAYAYSTTQIKNYNKAKLGEAMSQYQQKYDAALANEVKYHKEIADSQTAINKNKKAEGYYQNIANAATKNGWAATLKKYEAQQWNMKATQAERTQAAAIVPLLKNHGELLYKNLADLYKQNNELSKTISHDKSQLSLANSIYNKMVHITLEQAGVNDQKYKGIVAVDREISKQESVLSRLRSQHAQGKLNNAQYDQAVKSVQGQIDKLQGVRNKVISINGSAKVLNQTLSRDILKHIQFTGDTLTDARSINQALLKKVYKDVVVGVEMPGYKQVQIHALLTHSAYANGTKGTTQSETALVGERGREFVHDPNVGTYLANGPMIVNLSRGSSVLKNYDTERLGKSLGLPGFASGVGDYFAGIKDLPDIISGMTENITSALKSAINKQLSRISNDPPGSGVERWAGDVKAALGMLHLSTSASMVDRILRQIKTESGGNSKALGGDDGLKDGRAMGLMQVKPGTFKAYHLQGFNDIWKGFDNMLAGLNYAQHRYGKSLSFLGQGHGYANGGWITSEQIATLGEGNKPEMVLPLTNQARSLQLMQQALAYLSNGQSQQSSQSGSASLQNVVARQDAQLTLMQKQIDLLAKLLLKDFSIDPNSFESGVSKAQAKRYKNQAYMSGINVVTN